MKTITYCVKNLLSASQIYFMRWAGSSARQSELNLPSKAPDSVSITSREAKLLGLSCAFRRNPGVAGSNPARPATHLTKELKRKMQYNNFNNSNIMYIDVEEYFTDKGDLMF